MRVNLKNARTNKISLILIFSIILLSGCANSEKTQSEMVSTKEEGSMKLAEETLTEIESAASSTHGVNGEDVKCPVNLPDQAVTTSAMGWTIPATGPEVISPEFTEICKFTYLEQGYVVTIAEFNSRTSMQSALKGLEDPDQGFIYMGVPTSFIANKIPKEGVITEGIMSTDDCGMAGDEVMDENCAMGYSLMRWEGNTMVVISDMFINNHSPITNIPQAVISKIFSKSN